jgi:hypothetical protein
VLSSAHVSRRSTDGVPAELRCESGGDLLGERGISRDAAGGSASVASSTTWFVSTPPSDFIRIPADPNLPLLLGTLAESPLAAVHGLGRGRSTIGNLSLGGGH